MGSYRYLFHLYFILCLCFSTLANADSYPWIWMGKNDIQVTDHPRVEAEFRLNLVRNAKVSIDILTFDQRADELVGMPLLLAIEEAAQRGVKIRFGTAWLAPILKDPLFKASRFLSRVAKNYPNLQYMEVGGTAMRNRGWGYIDGIHEKLFIVDGKILLVTGRGHAGEYLRWLDTAFFMKGKLVDQSISAFDHVWNALRSEYAEANQSKNGESDLESEPPSLFSETPHTIESVSVRPNSEVRLPLTSAEINELESLKSWKNIPPSEEKEYKARLLHFDFFNQMRNQELGPGEYSYDDRDQILKDPVLLESIELLKHTKNFHLSILATILHPKLKEAILDGFKRGMNAEILTNGVGAHASITPGPLSIGWYAGLKDFVDIMGDASKEKFAPYSTINAYALGEVQSDPDSAKFLHRKLAIFDDTVIFGSHNLTVSSTLTQDEVSFEIESADFADRMRKLSKNSIQKNSQWINPDRLYSDFQSSSYKQWLSKYFDKLYLEVE